MTDVDCGSTVYLASLKGRGGGKKKRGRKGRGNDKEIGIRRNRRRNCFGMESWLPLRTKLQFLEGNRRRKVEGKEAE